MKQINDFSYFDWYKNLEESLVFIKNNSCTFKVQELLTNSNET